jgi:hypothetical protein
MEQKKWIITPERIRAIKTAVGDIDLADNIFYLAILRDMIREIGE